MDSHNISHNSKESDTIKQRYKYFSGEEIPVEPLSSNNENSQGKVEEFDISTVESNVDTTSNDNLSNRFSETQKIDQLIKDNEFLKTQVTEIKQKIDDFILLLTPQEEFNIEGIDYEQNEPANIVPIEPVQELVFVEPPPLPEQPDHLEKIRSKYHSDFMN